MAIRLKVASAPKEMDDALWIRHEVYVKEDGKFGGKPLPEERIVDRYDVIPEVALLVAYEGNQPVATLRASKDIGGGLPAEKHFDFSPWRKQFDEEARAEGLKDAVVACGGMLAVRERWRGRRDVIRALYKIAASVVMSWKTTHIVALVSHDTAVMYRRLGFEIVADQFWVEEIGNYVVPIVARAKNYYHWAFGNTINQPMALFDDNFERLLLRSSEQLFKEGDPGEHAYILDEGNIKISRDRADGSQMVLALLGRGDLLGELALIDDLPRSATATAEGDVELISLERASFERQMSLDSRHLHSVMGLFAKRLRSTDEMAMVLAFETNDKRLEFALNTIRAGARPNNRRPSQLEAKATAVDVARVAIVSQGEAHAFLERKAEAGEIELGRTRIRFSQ